jgi:hypothetical protein
MDLALKSAYSEHKVYSVRQKIAGLMKIHISEDQRVR